MQNKRIIFLLFNTKRRLFGGAFLFARMDHEAAMDAFSAFINDQSLNPQQIDFVKKVITHIENNGYMEDLTVLLKAPFEKPISFQKLFDLKRQKELVDAINRVKENALVM